MSVHQSICGVLDIFLPLEILNPFICRILWLSSVFSWELPSLPFLSIPNALVLFTPCLNYSGSHCLWLVFKNSQPLCLQVLLPPHSLSSVLWLITHMLDIFTILSSWTKSYFKVCVSVHMSVSSICFSLGFGSFEHSDILGNLCKHCSDKLRLWVLFSSSWEDLLLLLAGSWSASISS